MKKKITIFLPSLEHGGAENVYVNLANFYCHQNFKVDFLLTKKKGPLIKRLNSKINIVDFDQTKTIKSIFFLLKYFFKNKPGIFLTALHNSNIAASISHKIAGSKSVLVLKECNNFSEKINNMNFLKKYLFKLLINITYKRANFIVAPSKGIKKDFLKYFKNFHFKTKVIYNPISVKQIVRNSKIKTELLLKKKFIISIGRLAKQKNYQCLIKAFNLLKIKNLNLIILGEGKERENLSSLIDELNLNSRVKLIGYNMNPFFYLKKSELFVLSSNYEGMPNSLLEAMALNKKIVSTNCNYGPSELLKNEKYAKLTKINNPIHIANSIEYVLNLKGKPNYSKKLKQISIEKISNQYLKLLNK